LKEERRRKKEEGRRKKEEGREKDSPIFQSKIPKSLNLKSKIDTV
jgi:hypothetical protein